MLNILNQPSRFTTKNWVGINDGSGGAYNIKSQMKFKTSMLKSISCDCSNTYILVKGTITITREGDDDPARQRDEKNKEVVFKILHYSLTAEAKQIIPK